MPTNYNRLAVSSEYSAVNYLPATLKTNKSGWLIEYYVENPQTQELARKRIKLERLLSRYPSDHRAGEVRFRNPSLCPNFECLFKKYEVAHYGAISTVLPLIVLALQHLAFFAACP